MGSQGDADDAVSIVAGNRGYGPTRPWPMEEIMACCKPELSASKFLNVRNVRNVKKFLIVTFRIKVTCYIDRYVSCVLILFSFLNLLQRNVALT